MIFSKIDMRKILLFILLFVGFRTLSQMSVDYPYNNQVFQRNFVNSAEVSFLGKVPKEANKVEYQLIAIDNGKEKSSAWKVLDTAAIGGFYQGKLDILGGLYKLKVRSLNKNIVLDSAVLNRFGVGEVYIIAGQSNAQGIERTYYESGTNNEMVITANFSSYYKPQEPDKFSFIGENNLDFPTDKFEVLKNSAIIGPTGASNFFWPQLGEKIANTLNVPVCFFNVAWSGTSIRNWAESSRGIASKNPWIDAYYAKGFPFDNLKQVIKSYAGTNGIRAILWQIGETDNVKQMSTTDFVNYFKEVQSNVTKITGLKIPFVLAQSTYNTGLINGVCGPLIDNSKIIAGYEELFKSDSNSFLRGPNTDLIDVPRLATEPEACTHFSPKSFASLGSAWFDKLIYLYSTIRVANAPIPLPSFQKYCGKLNSNMLGFSSTNFDLYSDSDVLIKNNNQVYENLNGKKIYMKYIGNQNIILKSPLISINNFSKPEKPVLITKTSPNICDGGNVVILNKDKTPIYWNTGVLADSIKVSNSGSYFAFKQDNFNCKSDSSNSIKVSVYDNPKQPTITQSNPYFLYGGLKVYDTEYHWSLNNLDLNKSDVYLKVNQPGTYKLYATKSYSKELTCKSTLAEFSYALPNDGGLTAYPNPIGIFGQLTIESISNLSNATYQLLDLLGNTVKEGIITTDDSFKLDVNGLATGKYILNIITKENKVYTRQILAGK
jgi:hypothetical protein